MTSSRLIRGVDVASGCVAWQAPEVARPGSRGTFRSSDDGDLTALQQRAWQQGFEQGRVAGVEAGSRELAEHVAAVEHVLDALARPLEDLDQRIETELLEVVKAVVRQLVRREVRHDPQHVIGVIREALAALPLATEDVVVRLHPDDAAVVHESLGAGDGDRKWTIETDPLMERGGCLVATSRSNVDARLDARLARVIAGLLEDERASPD